MTVILKNHTINQKIILQISHREFDSNKPLTVEKRNREIKGLLWIIEKGVKLESFWLREVRAEVKKIHAFSLQRYKE